MPIAFNVERIDWNKVDATNVEVTALHWRVTQTETVGEDTFGATYYDVTGPDTPRQMTLQALAAITKSQCLQWVRNRIGAEREAEILASLQAQIDEQQNPTAGSVTPVEG